MEKTQLRGIASFLARYATTLLAVNVHTSRVARNAKRLGEALGVDVRMTSLIRTITLTVTDPASGRSMTEVAEVVSKANNFRLNSELSALSWRALDDRYPQERLEAEFDRIVQRASKPSFRLQWGLISFSNSCFCLIFGGDILAVLMVFLATAGGFRLRHYLTQRHHLNHYIGTAAAAFTSASIAALSLWLPDANSNIAVATSVLYLIPGVPLINGTIDILEGHTISGTSRLIGALLIVISISTGLALSLLFFSRSLVMQ